MLTGGVELQAELGEAALAAEGADEIAATLGWSIPCPCRCGRLEAEQDTLVPVREAALNARFLRLGNLPHDDSVALAIFPQELVPGFPLVLFPSGRLSPHPSPWRFSHSPCPTVHRLLCSGGLHNMPMRKGRRQLVISL
jgi:hypothetical protein